MKVVDAISKEEVDAAGVPVESIVIEKVKIQ